MPRAGRQGPTPTTKHVRVDYRKYSEQDYSQALLLVKSLRRNQVRAVYADWAKARLSERILDPDKIVITMLCMEQQNSPIADAESIYDFRVARGLDHAENGYVSD